MICSKFLLLVCRLPAELLYNYAVSDISKAFVNDNAEAATKTYKTK